MRITIKPELYRLSVRNPLHWLAVGFGSGLSPKAPGTFGSLAAIPFYYLFLQWFSLPAYLVILVVAFFLGVWACRSAANAIGEHDHGAIVWDEFIGMWIACIALPSGIVWMLFAFIAFRFFDILKPWPIRWFDENLSGGFGIMMDDVIAGIAALGIVQLTHLVL